MIKDWQEVSALMMESTRFLIGSLSSTSLHCKHLSSVLISYSSSATKSAPPSFPIAILLTSFFSEGSWDAFFFRTFLKFSTKGCWVNWWCVWLCLIQPPFKHFRQRSMPFSPFLKEFRGILEKIYMILETFGTLVFVNETLLQGRNTIVEG